ncbi:carbohydrate kinase family protein [Georgenia ruanii]|uniref:Carbohydrate kinase family protein n=1 Tax=Georgenia ruanii TaxID=348442 RepID=A0A7J9UT73_9MICO|nr:carbohydrate kinase family protein [Georgenia ruanii]MPV87825.1 carbohydrate kinase family protein [Georgenia ruanii]
MSAGGAVTPVVVLGDANVDLVLRGDVVPRFGQAEQLVESGELVLGGSASIAAAGLARLGVPTTLISRVGDDAFGRYTVETLEACGVVVEAEVDTVLPTGFSVILSTPGDRAILTVPGTIPTLRAARVRDALAGRPPGHVHVASYFLQPALAAELPALLADLRRAGWTTSLDTNWDPAERWTGLADVLQHVDVLLPNTAELRAIATALGPGPGGGRLGADADDDVAAARAVASLGPRVAVKDGADGGWSVGASGPVVRAAGLEVDVVDTTGAGDSFDAGYLAAMAHGRHEEAVRLRWATATGSLSTLGAGGTGRQATLADLRPLGMLASHPAEAR